MRAIPRVIALALVLAGCSRAFIRTDPPIARISVGGRQVGVGSATIATPKGRIVIVHADHEGFRPACAVVQYRRDTTIGLHRAGEADPALPPDAEIEHAWITGGANLCEWIAQQPAVEVTVTAGDLSRPYEVLGEVRVDTTDRASPAFRDVLVRGALLATIRPELKGEQAEMLDALRAAAIARFGARVDAVINANVFTEDRDVFARGVAVHFVERASGAAAVVIRSTEDRLDELERLRAAGRITREEYEQKRKAILGDL